LDDLHIEIVAGVNLPMLLKAVSMRDKKQDLGQAVEVLRDHGRNNIFNARDLLSKK
jgi:mannose/fructose-specific phosphotransferase system component IIA